MEHSKDIGAIALVCDQQGLIQKVVRDELGLPKRLCGGQTFVELVDHQSVVKAKYFLTTLRAHGKVYGWQFNVLLADRMVPLYFCGTAVDDHLLIAGATSFVAASSLCEELLPVNDDRQDTAIAEGQQSQNDQLFVEFSRLNNDLATTQRELAKKVTELEQLAVENARLYQESQEALRIRNEFLSVITHDLKTPITSIKGYAQLLKRRIRPLEIPEATQLDRAVDQIERITTRMTGQINELLDIARLQMGQSIELDRQPVDLIALTRQIVDELQPMSRRPAITIQTSLDKLVGYWDIARIERVLINLLSNAIKYSPQGGEILVEITQEIPAGPSGGWAILRVQDQGIGIPAGDLPHIFEPFRRSKNSEHQFSGTGIGLTSSHQIVVQHGGTIDVVSTEGVGSTFTVRLPLMPSDHGS